MHNGYFTDLYDVVHFFNTRDVVAWPEAEVLLNINITAMGDPGLTYDEEMAPVAFMKTLSDGYVP